MADDSGSRHDIFVSYAHIDNADQWVTRLIERLRISIEQRLGAQPVAIYCDKQLRPNKQLNDVLTHVRNSTLFLAIGSRAYVQRPWTNRELETFWEATGDPERIFVLEFLPLARGMAWPKLIEGHARQKFYKSDETDRTSTPLTLEDERSRFTHAVHKLAEEMAEQIRKRATSAGDARLASGTPFNASPQTAAATPLAPGYERKTVLLAQTTEGLEDEAEQVRSYLRQFGTRVLPEEQYPQGGAEFQAAFLMDLREADLVVQLLDRRPGRCPPDLVEGYTAYQAAAAKEHGVELLQWRHPQMDVDGVPEPFRTVLKQASVIASGLEEFKAMIKARALVPVAVDRPKNDTVVFINAAQADLDLAHSIEAVCSRYHLVSVLPLYDQQNISYEDLRENLLDSDAVIYLYGSAKAEWVRRQLRFFIKHVGRVNAPKILAVCTGPPREKPDINFNIPGSRVIDRRDDTFVAEIDHLLAELAP